LTRIAAAAALAFVVAACGSTRHVAPGCVRVFFKPDATRASEQPVKKRLERDRRVTRIVFVSKAQALREMKRKQPDLFSTVPAGSNPLPDALRVRTRDAAAARTLVRDLRGRPRALDLVKRTRRGC
jgi:cell division protein FtsX